MSNEKKPFTWDKKKVLALLLLVLILGLVFAYRGSRVEAIEAIPSATEDNAQFILASWDYPDEYGQGIEKLSVFSNETGSWLPANWAGDSSREYYEANEFDWNASIFIKLSCWTWFNSTLTGATGWEDGKNYQRHSVNVATNNGTQIFSQQNFTFANAFPAIDPPMWYYEYDVILNFLPLDGEIYTVTVDYEVYYEDVYITTTILTATDGSTDADTPTGSYTDTHSVNDVFFGGTDPVDISVILWVEFSEEINGFNYSAYWNSSHSSDIYIYNHNISDWSLLDSSPNGEGAPLAWDNDTVVNEDYFNSTSIGFKFYCESIAPPVEINIDYFQVQMQMGLPLDWHTINSPKLYFNVPWHMWGYNVGLIILGLCMIPASTMYLAYGVKHDRSSERMFYGLIIFAVGFGLLVAGVTP